MYSLVLTSKCLRPKNIHKNANLGYLLAELGVKYQDIEKQDKEWILYDAKEAYLKLIKIHHPDAGGNLEDSTYLNTLWTTIEERLTQKPKIIPDFQTPEPLIKKRVNISEKISDKPQLQEILCVSCKKLFLQSFKTQKFCTEYCRVKSYKRIQEEISKICLACKKSFFTTDSKQKFCGNSCRRRHWKLKLPYQLKCHSCDNIFEASDRERKFCGPVCRKPSFQTRGKKYGQQHQKEQNQVA